jgi:hypothetical protein
MSREDLINHIITVNLMLVRTQINNPKCLTIEPIRSYLKNAICVVLKDFRVLNDVATCR